MSRKKRVQTNPEDRRHYQRDEIDILMDQCPMTYTRMGKLLGMTPHGFIRSKQVKFDIDRARVVEQIIRNYGTILAQFHMPESLIKPGEKKTEGNTE